MSILHFLGSTPGRWARGIVGVVLIVIGLLLGGGWWLLVALGAVFLAAGSFDFCLLAPLAGKPLRGAAFRRSFSS